MENHIKFNGYFIGSVTELDELYSVKLLHKGFLCDCVILCFILKSIGITRKDLETYIIYKKEVVVSSIILKNTIVDKESSQEAQLQIGVNSVEDIIKKPQKFIDRVNKEKIKLLLKLHRELK